jgi:type II secretory pathway component PulF
MMVAASRFLTGNLAVIGAGLVALVVGLVVAARSGALTGWWEELLLDGPLGGTTRSLIYGAFAIALGNMLAAGAPMSEALRLALRSVPSNLARKRLEPVLTGVRQGQALPTLLQSVKGAPSTLVRMAAVGEASGALGPMLGRAGKLEEEAALRRIEAIGRLLGPAFIILLGGLIGGLMAGLLSGVSALGQTALQ